MKIESVLVKKLSLFTVLVIVVLGGVMITPQRVFSLGMTHSSSGLTYMGFPFGGPISRIKKCTCQGNTQLLSVYDFATHSSKKILYSPGKSKLYDFSQGGNFKVGQYILGTADFGGICIYGSECKEFDFADGTINAGPGAGTSGPLSQSLLPRGSFNNTPLLNSGSSPVNFNNAPSN